MSEELKPCPFCGSKAEVYPDGDMEGHSIMCSNFGGLEFAGHSSRCPMGTFGYATQEEAESAWNRRADSDEITQLRAEVATLAEQNQKMREALDNFVDHGYSSEQAKETSLLLSLPNLSTIPLARVRAEAFREAAELVRIVGVDWEDAGMLDKRFACDYLLSYINAKADELEGKEKKCTS